MQIANFLSLKHHQLDQAASAASSDYWQIKSSPKYRASSDFSKVRQLQVSRATLVAAALGDRLDDAFGRGPSRLSELRHTKGKTFTERCRNETIFWRQVVSGGVNLGLKVFLHGAANLASFLTLGQVFRGVELSLSPLGDNVPRGVDRRLAQMELRLAPVLKPWMNGLQTVKAYFAGVDG